ncbi:hypothetical protein ACH4U6_15590 [Streptomyces netropsis]|uniref:hypothetical protein n=1 Tax=Streptomyces netropsis TaxID=55404 RepID=UPI0037AC2386
MRSRFRRPVRTALAGVALFAAASTCLTAAPARASASAAPSGATVAVALGDSFVSGEGGRWLGNTDRYDKGRNGTDRAWNGSGYDPSRVYGATGAVGGCHRSDVSEIVNAPLAVDERINLACSGAETEHVLSTAKGGRPLGGEAPQLDRLAASWARYTLVPQLSAAIRAVAEDRGTDFLDLQDTMSGHEVCSLGTSRVGVTGPDARKHEWFHFLDYANTQGTLEESMHPNAFGQQALGSCLGLVTAAKPGRYTCLADYLGDGTPTAMRIRPVNQGLSGGSSWISERRPVQPSGEGTDPRLGLAR